MTTGALAAESDRKKGADRHWTSAMTSIQIRIDDLDDPSQPSEVIRWERNRHMGQHKEGIELHRCLVHDHALLFVQLITSSDMIDYAKITLCLIQISNPSRIFRRL
jgi:hypothetical protein